MALEEGWDTCRGADRRRRRGRRRRRSRSLIDIYSSQPERVGNERELMFTFKCKLKFKFKFGFGGVPP